jgi:hypothetical protein
VTGQLHADAASRTDPRWPGAHLAVLLRQHGVRTLHIGDSEFERFDFLDFRDPFA